MDLYITELVNQFTAEHVADERLFRLLLETPAKTSAGQITVSYCCGILKFTCWRIGYRPQIQECVTCPPDTGSHHPKFILRPYRGDTVPGIAL